MNCQSGLSSRSCQQFYVCDDDYYELECWRYLSLWLSCWLFSIHVRGNSQWSSKLVYIVVNNSCRSWTELWYCWMRSLDHISRYSKVRNWTNKMFVSPARVFEEWCTWDWLSHPASVLLLNVVDQTCWSIFGNLFSALFSIPWPNMSKPAGQQMCGFCFAIICQHNIKSFGISEHQ